MNANLLFDFTVDKSNNRIHVKREFNAELPLVWKAWTTPEILDLWWAPKPWKTETKTMDFREGGYWLYAMKGPKGEIHWGRNEYLEIDPLHMFVGLDSFCDEDGVINTEVPRTTWVNKFTAENGHTFVNIELTYKSAEALETMIKMGFKEGFTMGLNNLDQYLEEQLQVSK